MLAGAHMALVGPDEFHATDGIECVWLTVDKDTERDFVAERRVSRQARQARRE